MPAVTKSKKEYERPTVTGDERIGKGPGYLHGYRPAAGDKHLSRPGMHKPNVKGRKRLPNVGSVHTSKSSGGVNYWPVGTWRGGRTVK